MVLSFEYSVNSLGSGQRLVLLATGADRVERGVFRGLGQICWASMGGPVVAGDAGDLQQVGLG